MSKARSGGGIQGNKNVKVPVRTGSNAKGVNPGGADQLGQHVGRRQAATPLYGGPAPTAAKVPLGNEIATNVGKGGPGAGRTTYARGTQATHGPVNPGEGNRPEGRGFDVRGRSPKTV